MGLNMNPFLLQNLNQILSSPMGGSLPGVLGGNMAGSLGVNLANMGWAQGMVNPKQMWGGDQKVYFLIIIHECVICNSFFIYFSLL